MLQKLVNLFRFPLTFILFLCRKHNFDKSLKISWGDRLSELIFMSLYAIFLHYQDRGHQKWAHHKSSLLQLHNWGLDAIIMTNATTKITVINGTACFITDQEVPFSVDIQFTFHYRIKCLKTFFLKMDII